MGEGDSEFKNKSAAENNELENTPAAAAAAGGTTTSAPPLKKMGRGHDAKRKRSGSRRSIDIRDTGTSRGRRRVSSLGRRGGGQALRSVEGFVVFASGVHEEATDDDLYDVFADFGKVQALHVNLDRRTGYAKGYALVEYGELKEAEAAIRELDGTDVLGSTIRVGLAFSRGPV